ncbi:hypothetical protein T09_9714, partial [Trichinella sp. T9]
LKTKWNFHSAYSSADLFQQWTVSVQRQLLYNWNFTVWHWACITFSNIAAKMCMSVCDQLVYTCTHDICIFLMVLFEKSILQHSHSGYGYPFFFTKIACERPDFWTNPLGRCACRFRRSATPFPCPIGKLYFACMA